MDHQFVSRVLLSLLCGVQGIATVVIDLNRTHATNPTWARHARFHVVWQTLTMALLAVLEVVLLWGNMVSREGGFYLALLLATVSPVAFLLAWVGRRLFDGALSDPVGIPPVRLVLFGRLRAFDLNMVAVLVALLCVVGIGMNYRR